jgi:hypothetical protein
VLECYEACDIYNADNTGLFKLLARLNAGTEGKTCHEGVTNGSAVYKQQCLRQMSAHRYWKARETMVFRKYKKATCDLLRQLKSMDDVGDFPRLSAYSSCINQCTRQENPPL